MDIFESLESLPVSESCFEDIVGLIEEYLSEGNTYQNIIKKHGYPEWEKNKNKSADLMDKLDDIRWKEAIDAGLRLAIADGDKEAKEKGISGESTSRAIGMMQKRRLNNQKSNDELGYGMDEYNAYKVYGDDEYQKSMKKREPRGIVNSPHQNSSTEYEKLPSYQHYKKIARKGLRGHSQESGYDESNIHNKINAEVKEPNNSNDLKNFHISLGELNKGISRPKTLYRIGKAIEKHRNQKK